MKKFMFVSVLVFVAFIMACASQQQQQQSSKDGSVSVGYNGPDPIGSVNDLPCVQEVKSDPKEYFFAVGSAEGSYKQLGNVSLKALENAQDLCRQMMRHSVLGLRSYFNNNMGGNNGNDIEEKATKAYDQVINQTLNDTEPMCGPKKTGVDNSNHLMVFYGIRIAKKELNEKGSQAVSNALTQEEKARIQYDEEKFREFMNKYMAEHPNN